MSSTLNNPTSVFREVVSRDFGPVGCGHSKKVAAIGWSRDGRLASAAVETKIWDIDGHGNARLVSSLEGTSSSTQDLEWDPTGANLVAMCASDKSLKVWDVRSGRVVQNYTSDGENLNISWSPNGQYIAMGSLPSGSPSDGDIMGIYDVRNSKKRLKTVRFFYAVNDFIWSPSGEFLITSTGDGYIELIRINSVRGGARMTRFKRIIAHSAACFALVMEPHEFKYMAVGSADGLVSLWDVDNLVCMRTMPRLENSVRALSFSHNGRYLASANDDNFVDIADVETADCAHRLNLGRSTSCMSWHPSQLLLAGASSKDLGLWAFREHDPI